MKDDSVKIGLVGVGTMGRCMLDKLLEHRYQVTVFDVVPSAVEDAVQKGAEAVAEPQELVHKTDLILLSLPGPVQLESVIFGAQGLTSSLECDAEHKLTIIDTSTVDPETTRSIAKRLSLYDVAYLDAPILGRPSAVGNWLLPVGGKPEVLEKYQKVLSCFAKTSAYVGDSGAGNVFKLLNQLMFSVINAISCEVFAIAEASGIDSALFYETIAGSSAATVSGLFKEVGKNIVRESFDQPTFTVSLLHKDASLALAMADQAGAPSMIGRYIQIINELAVKNNLGRLDTSSMVKFFRNQIGKDLSK